jgi:ankyrin repeat protein
MRPSKAYARRAVPRGAEAGKSLVLALLTSALAAITPLAAAETGPAERQLANAVRQQDLAAAAALAKRADPNQPLPDGSTLLAWAVESQNLEMVQLLLNRGARPNSVGSPLMAPIFIACQYGDVGILDLLLKAGADATTARPDGITPLAMCAGAAPASILERMIAAGASVDAADDKGQTPLMWAAAKGRLENIQTLVKHGAEVNRTTAKGFTPLFFALKSGVPEAPVAVMKAGGDSRYVAPDGTSVVQLAMYQKAYDFAAFLIERGADLNAFDRNGNQLLHAAVLADQPALVTLLLAKGANVNALTGPSKVKLRFEVNFKTGDYEVPSRPPLIVAAEMGSAQVMKVLINNGADADFRMPDGTNVVLAAAGSGKLAALELALQIAPNANVATTDGQTPLHVLLGLGTGSEIGAMMKLLAARGARPDLRNRAGQSPVDLAQDSQTDAKTAFAATFDKKPVSAL